ncbi:MAG TPA: sodium:solute symporter family protein [Phycisphaerae bacterium]|nr:sodium:solute symporter family protein [Phycisphaerae bacterium]
MLASFCWLDWTIVLAYVVAASVIGLLCRRYIHSLADFVVAGRGVSTFLGVATLSGTEIGLVTVMYFAEFGFAKGFSALSVAVLAGVSMVFVGASGFMIAGLRRSGAMTLAEYYQIRYRRGVRLLGGIIIAGAGILNMGVFLKVGALFLQKITAMPEIINLIDPTSGDLIVSLPVINLIMTALLILVLAYTFVGGMVSVVITDYLQFVVLSAGIAIGTFYALTNHTVDGFDGIVRAVAEFRGEPGFNPFSTDIVGESFVGLGIVFIIWQAMHWLGTSNWQTYALRTTSVTTSGVARQMYVFTGLAFFGRAAIPMLWGLAALAYFAHAGGLESFESNRLAAMPTFLAEVLPWGALGLLTAGMIAAFMSTHDSYLLAWSAVICQDIIAPVASLFGRDLSDRARIVITRALILAIGLFVLWWSLWYQPTATIWDYLAITGTMYIAGAMMVLAFGLYWRRASVGGAYAALILGCVPGMVYIILGILVTTGKVSQLPHNAGAWAGLVSYPLALAGMIVGSLVWPHRGEPVAPAVPTGMPPQTPRPGEADAESLQTIPLESTPTTQGDSLRPAERDVLTHDTDTEQEPHRDN